MSTTEQTKGPETTAPKRIRRTAEEARRLILEAAEARLSSQGPDGIRLQDIARDVGISHPAILHHFESRQGLVSALVRHIEDQLRFKLLAALETSNAGKTDVRTLIMNLFEAMSDRGNARLLAWLALAGKELRRADALSLMTEITDKLHDQRVEAAKAHGQPAPDKEDTLFMSMLASNAAFGDAFSVRLFPEGKEGEEEAAKQRFRNWFAELLSEHTQLHQGQKPD